jgi:hypothetical protein
MKTSLFLSYLLVVFSAISAETPFAIQPVVETEEEVYAYESANNGSGPMWCSGSTCVVRAGEQVFFTFQEQIHRERPFLKIVCSN